MQNIVDMKRKTIDLIAVYHHISQDIIIPSRTSRNISYHHMLFIISQYQFLILQPVLKHGLIPFTVFNDIERL